MALVDDVGSDGRIEAWECVGCGRIEAPQTCIGVCRDRKLELVDAGVHQDALNKLREAAERIERLESLARRLARARPREGQWERSYRVLQEEATELLAALDDPVRRAG